MIRQSSIYLTDLWLIPLLQNPASKTFTLCLLTSVGLVSVVNRSELHTVMTLYQQNYFSDAQNWSI